MPLNVTRRAHPGSRPEQVAGLAGRLLYNVPPMSRRFPPIARKSATCSLGKRSRSRERGPSRIARARRLTANRVNAHAGGVVQLRGRPGIEPRKVHSRDLRD